MSDVVLLIMLRNEVLKIIMLRDEPDCLRP